MTGAMAGSTAIIHRKPSEILQVITLTINNTCKFNCPHCYLQYDGAHVDFNEGIIDSILKSTARHIAIVGKEPLVDSASVALTERIVSMCVDHGRTVSLVTNGLGLNELSPESISSLEWIDVSLDGGPTTYSRYRQGNFDHVIENIREVLLKGARAVNVLNTVSSLNLSNIDDMMSIITLVSLDKIVFSPYAPKQGHKEKGISPVSLNCFLSALNKSDAFSKYGSAFVLIGSNSFQDQGLDAEAVNAEITKAGLNNKVIFVEQDPLLLGYLRITYDGYLLTPYQSLNPSNYLKVGVPLKRYSSLDSAYQYLRVA